MTKEEIKRTIERIRELATDDDPETAHLLEDSLYHDFVLSLTKREDEVGEIAKIIASTRKIRFPRWCG